MLTGRMDRDATKNKQQAKKGQKQQRRVINRRLFPNFKLSMPAI